MTLRDMTSRGFFVHATLLAFACSIGCEKLSGLSDLEVDESAAGSGGALDGGAGAAGAPDASSTGGGGGQGGQDGGAGGVDAGTTGGSAGSGGAAGQDAGEDAPVAGFSLMVPANLKVVRGKSAALNVTITRDAAFSGAVDVSVSVGLPSGVTSTQIALANPDASGVLSIDAQALAALGHATITVHAVSGAVVRDQNVDLLVADPPGTLDETFNGVGMVGLALSDKTVAAKGVAVQADGRIVVVGKHSGGQFAIARFLEDGTLDASFGSGGTVVSAKNGELNGVAIQPNGRIVAVGTGSPHITLMRVLADGKLDPTFGNSGYASLGSGSAASSKGLGLVLQSDGKIVAAGSANSSGTLFRYLGDGTLDNSFSSNGQAAAPETSTLYGVALQTNGFIVGAGTRTNTDPDMFLFRTDANGAPDTGLGGAEGKSYNVGVPDYAYGMALDSAGKIVMAGTDGSGMEKYAVVRVLPGGDLDSAFGTGGIVKGSFSGMKASFLRAVVLQPDDRILAIGYAVAGAEENSPCAVLRLMPNGTPDPDFAAAGLFLWKTGPGSLGHWLYAGAIHDGRLIAVGRRSDAGWMLLRLWL